MQHYIDVCAERDVSCIFEILRALELLELRPQRRLPHPHQGYRSGWRFVESGSAPGEEDEQSRLHVSLDLAPVMGPLTIMEKTHRTGRVFDPTDDPSMKLQLDAADVVCLTEALRRCNDDADVTIHRPLLHLLVSGAEAPIMTTGPWVALLAEWRKHVSACLAEASADTARARSAHQPHITVPSVFAARGCSSGLLFLVSLVEEAMSGPVSINITSALRGGHRRSVSPFSTDTDPRPEAEQSTQPFMQWGLDVSCNTLGGTSEHSRPTDSALSSCMDSIKTLWRQHGLRHLSLSYCDLGGPLEGPPPARTTAFFDDACQTLQTFSLRGCSSAFGLHTLSWLRLTAVNAEQWTLVRLDVSKAELTDEAATVLADILKRSTSLKVLMARNNYFTHVGFAAFAESLVHPSCCLNELYLGMQSPPPAQQRRTASPTSTSAVAVSPFLHIRGASPSLYENKKGQRPPTAVEAMPGPCASYHVAATTILVALGGNRSIHVCDLTGLPLDEPVDSSRDSTVAPFIILSALSDLILNTNTLHVLCLTFPSTLQTPMRKELKRNSTCAAVPSQHNVVPHYQQSTSCAGAASKPSLHFPSKALFEKAPSSTQAREARVSSGPLDAFVQPPMRFSSGSATSTTHHISTTSHTASSAPAHQLQHFAGPTLSGTSIMSASSSNSYHLATGQEFEEFLVAVNTQRELRGFYPMGVRNGCPQDAAALELFVQHPLDVSGFVCPPTQPHGEASRSSATLTPPPPSVPPLRRGSPQAAPTGPAPSHRHRSADVVKQRKASPQVAAFRPSSGAEGNAPTLARRPVVASGSGSALTTPRGAQRWATPAAVATPTPTVAPPTALGVTTNQSRQQFVALLDTSMQHIVNHTMDAFVTMLDTKMHTIFSSYLCVNEEFVQGVLERAQSKWSSLRDREMLLRQEMQRAIDDRHIIEQRQRELDLAEGEQRYRLKQLEERIAQLHGEKQARRERGTSPAQQLSTQSATTDAASSPFGGIGDQVHNEISREGGKQRDVPTPESGEPAERVPASGPPSGLSSPTYVDSRSDSKPSSSSTASNNHSTEELQQRTNDDVLGGVASGSTMTASGTPVGRPPVSQNRSVANSPMEAPTPLTLHVSPHPLFSPQPAGSSPAPSLLRVISTMRFKTVCDTYSRFQVAMSALSTEERSTVEGMWTNGRTAAIDESPGSSIHPHRLALVGFIARCHEQHLFGDSQSASPEACNLSHLLQTSSAAPPLTVEDKERAVAVEPKPSASLDDIAAASNAPSRPLSFGSSSKKSNSPSRRSLGIESKSKSAVGVPTSGKSATFVPSPATTPLAQRSVSKNGPVRQASPPSQRARVAQTSTAASSPPPRINSLALRRRSEIIRRYDEELSVACKPELPRTSVISAASVGSTAAPQRTTARRSRTRGSSMGGHVPPNAARGKRRTSEGADGVEDCPTESVQFDLEDRTSTGSLDFEEYDVGSDAGDGDYVAEPASPPPRHAQGTHVRLHSDDAHESIHFDEMDTHEASPEFVAHDHPSGPSHPTKHQRQDSVSSSVDFDEEQTQHAMSPERLHQLPPQVDLFSSLRRPPTQQTTPSKYHYTSGALLKSPASQRVQDRIEPVVLGNTERVEREREFVRVKIMPLSVAELRTRFPEVRHVLESMTMEEYESFMAAWSSRFSHGHADALADLKELMLRCALCGMFKE